METKQEIKYVGWILTSLFALIVIGAVFFYFSFRYPTVLVTGGSMEPTIHDPETVRYDPEKTPKENDVIVFDCLVEKCHGKILIKRIIKINSDGSLWVEGDNKDHSTDSRKYGALYPTDIKIWGVVVL